MTIPDDYLKQIKIEMSGDDISEYFETPVLENINTEIFIASKADHILDFTSGKKTVKVTVPELFYYELPDGTKVQMAEDSVLEYTINQETIEKLALNLKKGSYGDYDTDSFIEKNILESEVINFTLKENCFFSSWDFSTENIDNGEAEPFVIEDDTEYEGSGSAKLLKATVHDSETGLEEIKTILRFIEPSESDAKILEASRTYRVTIVALNPFDEKIIVKPIAFERPAVTVSPSAGDIVPKNQPISISFNKTMTNMDEMISEIEIEVDGVSVLGNFETPSYKDNLQEITFNSDITNLINTENTTKTVTVTIPKDFHYTDNGVDIDLGQDKIFTYKITSATSVKGDFSFNNGNAGNTKINYNSNRSYNIGDDFTVMVTSEDPSYQYGGWYIATDSGVLPDDCLKIEKDDENKQVKITVLRQITNVEVRPVYYKRPMVQNFMPLTTGINTVCKDSSIVIDFASEIDEKYVDQIQITKNGEDIKDCFLSPVLSENKTVVTFDADYTKLMQVSGVSEAVVVTIPEDISYTIEGNTPEENIIVSAGTVQTKTYRAKNETVRKLIINLQNITGGTINFPGVTEVSIGDSIDVNFNANPGHIFQGWEVQGVSSLVSYKADQLDKTSITLTAKSEGQISLVGKAIYYPEISDYEPKYTSVGTNCDTPIVVTFNTKIDPSTLNSSTIKLTNRQTGEDYTDEYFTFSSVVTDKGVTVLTITPDPYINKLFMGTKTSYSIDVKFNKNEIYADTGSSLEEERVNLTGKDNWYYTINAGYEDVLPVMKEIHLYKDADYTKELTAKNFSEWEDADFSANHVKNLYVKVIGYDADSGLKQLDVSEKYLKTIATADVVKDPELSVMGTKDSFVLLKDENEEPLVDENGNKLYEFKGKYNFSKNFNDGVMKLEFRLVDRAGDNGTVFTDYEKERGNFTRPQTFYVIKDTSIAVSHIRPSSTNTNYDNRTLNSDGKDTIRLNFSPYYGYYYKYMTDSYYGDYYDDLNMTNIAYGYSASNISLQMQYDEENKTFYFDRDPLRETYISITAEDSVGNSFTRVVAIPETGVLISSSKNLVSIENYNNNCPKSYKIPAEYGDSDGNVPEYTILVKDFSENCPIEYKNKYHATHWGCEDPENSGEIFWERGGGISQWNDIVNGASVFKSTETIVLNYDDSLEDCYYFYGLARYVQTTFLYAYDNWNIYGITSNIIDLYSENTENDFDPYIPKKFEKVELEILVPNLGTRFINTVFDTYTKKDDYKYVVGYQVCDPEAYNDETDEYNTFFSYAANNDFSLVSNRKYRIIPFVKIPSGDYIKNTNAEYYEIDLTGVENDNVPPTLILPEILSDRVSNKPGSVTLPFPYDKYGLLTDSEGNGIIRYWFVPNSTVTAAITPRPESYFNNEDARILKFDEKNPPENMVFNLDGLPEYSYTLFFKVEDKNHNYIFQSAYAKNVLYEPELRYEYFVDEDEEVSSDKTAAYFKCVFPQEQATSYVDFETFDVENKKWNVICDIYGCEYFPKPSRGEYSVPEGCTWDIRNNLTFYFSSSKGFYIDYDRSHNTVGKYSFDSEAKVYKAAEQAKFMRILGRDMPYGDGTANGYYKALYVYPKFLMGGMTCKTKFLLENAYGDIQVMADAPVLVHSFYSTSDYEENIDNWLNHGVEICAEQEDSGFTYDNDYLKEVPDGKYYTTIVHFADGTTRMSSVHKK